jgi:HEAT repeat protein
MHSIGGSDLWTTPVHQYLTVGKALILVDGWDELRPEQTHSVIEWLSYLIDILPGNLWLVGTNTQGYSPLTELGFVPLKLCPWSKEHLVGLVHNWALARNPEESPSTVAVNNLIAELDRASQSGTPSLEMALQVLVFLQDDTVPLQRTVLFNRAYELLTWDEDNPWHLEVCQDALGILALSQLQTGETTIQREQIVASVESLLSTSEETATQKAAIAIRALTGKQSILRLIEDDHYVFVHPLWQAYFAARQLTTVESPSPVDYAGSNLWVETLNFYAEGSEIEPLVEALLSQPGDILHPKWQTIIRWVGNAMEDTPWRNRVMRIVARTFLQPDLPLVVRRALARNLASHRISGVKYLFRQALEGTNPEIQIAAADGLAILAGETDLQLLDRIKDNDDPRILAAALESLTGPKQDAVAYWLERLFLSVDEAHLPAVARAIARCDREGKDFLREALKSSDVMLRRSAVAGLAEANDWGYLEEVAREDSDWLVRSAATDALARFESAEAIPGTVAQPKIDTLPWLISWAASRGESVGTDETARTTLRRALREGDPPVRVAAAHVLAQIGQPDDIEHLRAALQDVKLAVAKAALNALIEVSNRYDLQYE